MADYNNKLERFAVPLIIKLYKKAEKLGGKLIRLEERIPRRVKAASLLVIVMFAVTLAAIYLRDKNLAILNPQGYVAVLQKRLLVTAALMSLIVVIPVFIMTFYITYTYRSSNKKAKYLPEFDHNRKIETIWWGIPMSLIFVLSVITWRTSHSLDPFKPIASPNKPLVIQVVALNWKWLFIYPNEHVATINDLTLPMNRPVEFRITSDATMNSFWIPQLGSQVYAMSGMSTQMHLLANKSGLYSGASANISGKGFAGMKFAVHVVSDNDYTDWVNSITARKSTLNKQVYDTLAEPSENVPAMFFTVTDAHLYNEVLAKYMPGMNTTTKAQPEAPSSVDDMNGMGSMDGMHMGTH